MVKRTNRRAPAKPAPKAAPAPVAAPEAEPVAEAAPAIPAEPAEPVAEPQAAESSEIDATAEIPAAQQQESPEAPAEPVASEPSPAPAAPASEPNIVGGMVGGDILVPIAHPEGGTSDGLERDKHGNLLARLCDVARYVEHGFVVIAGGIAAEIEKL